MVAVVATGIAAALALALVVSVAGQPASSAPTVVTLRGVGADQISHNRSEEGLGFSSPISGQQIAHNRSEEGLSNP
jgi:hypothetical protein